MDDGRVAPPAARRARLPGIGLATARATALAVLAVALCGARASGGELGEGAGSSFVSSDMTSCSKDGEEDADPLSFLQSSLALQHRAPSAQLQESRGRAAAGSRGGQQKPYGEAAWQAIGAAAGGRAPVGTGGTRFDEPSMAYTLICAALVQLWTPGMAFFYGGLVRSTSVLTVMMQSYISMGITSLMWYFVVFSLCYGDSVSGGIGDPRSFFMLNKVGRSSLFPLGMVPLANTRVPALLFVVYKGMFAVIAPVIITVSFADRFRFKPYLVFLFLWPIFVYAPVCHWVWGGGFLMRWGVWDFAGGIVVHTTGGFGALASLLTTSRRAEGSKEQAPHNVPFAALGAAMLWFAWFGFNSGSALNAGGPAILAMVNSEIAGSTGLFTWAIIDWVRCGRPNLISLCTGALAGLSLVTPMAGFVRPLPALTATLFGVPLCYAGSEFLTKLRVKDPMHVWGVHGAAGMLGSVLLGLAADPEECQNPRLAPNWCAFPGTVTRSTPQFAKQLAATCIVAVYSFVCTWLLLKGINMILPLRLKDEIVDLGLDLYQYGQEAYSSPPSGAPKASFKANFAADGDPLSASLPDWMGASPSTAMLAASAQRPYDDTAALYPSGAPAHRSARRPAAGGASGASLPDWADALASRVRFPSPMSSPRGPGARSGAGRGGAGHGGAGVTQPLATRPPAASL